MTDPEGMDDPGDVTDGGDDDGLEDAPLSTDDVVDDGSTEDDDDSSLDTTDEFDARAEIARLESVVARQGEQLRNAGRVPGLQRAIADITAKLEVLDSVESINQQLAILRDGMFGQLDEETQRRLSEATSAADKRDAVRTARDEVLAKLGITEEDLANGDDDEQEGPTPEATAATAQVHGYARAKGIDPSRIPAEAYESAERRAGGDLTKATDLLIEWIDKQVAKSDATERRTGKKASGEQRVTAKADAAKGNLSLTAIKAMSTTELAALSEDEWERVNEVLSRG